jgi:hypothetical protein
VLKFKFYASLSEKDRRRFVALEAMKIGYYGGKETSKKYNIHPNTIRAGLKKLILKKPSLRPKTIKRVTVEKNSKAP